MEKKIKFKIDGVKPLMLNNFQVVNRSNKYAKMLEPLTSKKEKTEEEEQIFQIQFESSLYINDGVYVIPRDHFLKSLELAAKELKLSKRFKNGLFIIKDSVLDFPEKELSPEELYKDKNHVNIDVVRKSKSKSVAICRPIFAKWRTEVEILYWDEKLSEEDIIRLFDVAGSNYGVGAYRQKYGSFTARSFS